MTTVVFDAYVEEHAEHCAAAGRAIAKLRDATGDARRVAPLRV